MAGTSAHGQGHETAFAQLASAVLEVPMDKIRLVQSDTALVPQRRGHARARGRCRPAAARSTTPPSELVAAGPGDRRAPARGVRRRHRADRRRLRRAGRRRPVVTLGAGRDRGRGRQRTRGRDGGAAARGARLQAGPVELPVRLAHRRRRGRPRHRPGPPAPPRRGRRLRAHPQPDAGRRASSTAASRRASRRRCSSG